MAIPVNAIRPYRHLVRYAEWAYDNNNGTRFRSHLQDNELEGAPLHARMLQSNTSGSHNHVHLGIRNGNTLVMAFRGTDVPTNLENFAQSERWGAFLDYGLFNGRSLNGIEVCGHSLGEALATLCALWCSIRWPMVPITCLTIGSPKVGDAGFAQAFRRRNNITCYRLVIPSDPVPKVPNRTTEKIPFRISPDARCYFKWKDPGTPTWEHGYDCSSRGCATVLATGVQAVESQVQAFGTSQSATTEEPADPLPNGTFESTISSHNSLPSTM
ncbi:Phospholipase A1-II 3 [Fusarium oxysporum f. sp. raphani]|uniref:Phospholipase A1-II 3 n=1 Tax=Fusarium oxysporum f. sp. raphani TaxID=96318 RepID=A0A8J5TP31_FUSOX|nr:Phospholipase A1-II 3 [Fusarium oxysporum f. sp. raphani]